MADLSRKGVLDDAPGVVGITTSELPSMPDEVMANPLAGRIDPRRWFADPARRLELEIGCGKGSFILGEAAANPMVNYLGIEWAGEYYAYSADRIRRRGLANVRMLHADATDFLQWRCPDAILSVIHLYFSDPWPKRKHHKNRVIQDRFLAEAWRCLMPRGELRIVTDHDELWAWDVEHFDRWTNASTPRPSPWPALAPSPPFDRGVFSPPEWVDPDQVVGTNYERKMCQERIPFSAVLLKRG
jgi:tRNA (guanine-N7-)-methyltransferase